MFRSITEAFDQMMTIIIVGVVTVVPLAVWKVIDIVIWISERLTINVGWGQ